MGTIRSTTPQASTTLFWAAYYATLATFLIASFFPEQRLWGLNWWTYMPWQTTAIWFILATLLPLISRFLPTGSTEAGDGDSPTRWLALTAVVVSFFALAFYLFRTETHFLGDGYQHLARLETGGPPIRPWNPGVYFVQEQLFTLLGGTGRDTALLTFRFISYFSGVAFLVTAGLAALRLYSVNRDRLLFLLVMATGGYMLLYFGYVENYSLFVMLFALFSLTGLMAAADKLSRWLVVPLLLLAGLFHPFSVAMIPAAAYLLLKDTHLSRRWMLLGWKVKSVVIGATLLGVVSGFAYFYGHSYFLRFALMPFEENQFTVEGYWLFSTKHLLDLTNLLLLVLPGLPLALVLLFLIPVKGDFAKPEYRFLGLLLISSLVIVFLFDPKLGMPRDWDLFSFVGVPLTLLAGYMIIDRSRKLPGGSSVAILVIGLNVTLLIPRVVTQMVPEKSIALFDNYAALDRIKNRIGSIIVNDYLKEHGYSDEANRRLASWDSIYPQVSWQNKGRSMAVQGKIRESISEFKRLLRYDPSFYSGWANLGVTYSIIEQYDSGLTCLKIADGLNPYNVNTWTNLGGVYMKMGNQELAEKYWKEAIPLNSDSLISRIYLLRLYQMQGRTEDYVNILSSIAEHQKAPLRQLRMYADLLVKQGDFTAAAEFFHRALAKGLDSSYVIEMQREYPTLRVIQQ